MCAYLPERSQLSKLIKKNQGRKKVKKQQPINKHSPQNKGLNIPLPLLQSFASFFQKRKKEIYIPQSKEGKQLNLYSDGNIEIIRGLCCEV